ncbi:MAG: LTA synthase family protein [Lachnospiraceae bacterium]|jgi:phosphoglycerol transferase MdoB-like AlkP superfamily enzyme|nr:LTA synthase family protein [Lachnospiraceae bacterium]
MRAYMEKLRREAGRHPVLFSFAAAAALNFLVEVLSRRSLWKPMVFLVTRPHIFLYNTCIIFWCFSLLLLVKRKLFLGTVIGVVWLLLGFVNLVLLNCRVTPFNGADLRLTKDAMTIAGKYLTWWHLVLMAAGLLLLLAGLVVLFRKLPKWQKKPAYVKGSVFILFSLLALFGLSGVGMRTGLLANQFGNLAQAYLDYGFPYCFANSLVNTGISKPEDYSVETVQEIKEEEFLPEEHGWSPLIEEERPLAVDEQGMAVTRQTPNIIFLQLESFSDPMKYLHMECSEDPIPNFRRLKEQYSSGYLWVPAVGAGTANTEFEVITGMNLDFFGPGEYPYKTVLQKEVCESLCFDLKEIGYHAQAIHNNSGTFYDRYTVFSQLGFDSFTSLEYMNGSDRTYMGWAKDEMLTKQIAKVMKSTTGVDMIYTISVQGHGSYPEEKVLDTPEITVSGLPTEEETNAMEYYVAQLREMDSFVGELIGYLEGCGEETVLVMYGDHLPSLDLTEEKLENKDVFQTEYVIWDNIGLERSKRDVEAYQLGAWVLHKIGIQKGTMFRYHQAWLQELVHTEAETEKYLEDMKLLEYDILYGDQEVFEGKIPYEATELHMGVQPITISQVMTQNQGLYVTGWNYTPNSVVYLNGDACETDYVSVNLLYCGDVSLEQGENEITVCQVSEDNIVLSATEPYFLSYEKKEKP